MASDNATNWNQGKMRDVVEFYSGGDAFLKLEYTDHGIPVLAKGDVKPFGLIVHGDKRFISNELIDQRNYRKTIAGDFLLTTRDLTQDADFLGLLAPIPTDQEYLVNQGANIVRFNNKIDQRFIVYWCNGPIYRSYIKRHHVGSTQIHIRKDDFLDAPLFMPPLPEQRAIAHILGTLDDKIELNRKMNETLEAMARAIFKSWFVDFDPVRAKAEGRDTGLPKEIADLFPDSFEESELGDASAPLGTRVPKGWEVKTIGDISEIVGGSTPSTKESRYWIDGTHYWATPKDLSDLKTHVLFGTERKITDDGLLQIASGLLPQGTVLLSSRAPIGYLAISEIPVAINQGFIAMLPKNNVSNLFLLFWAEWAQEEIVSRANGSTFLEISKSNFRPIPLVAPSDPIFNAYEEIARPIYNRLICSVRESHNLATMRDALLPKLISGEIRVKDANRFSKVIE